MERKAVYCAAWDSGGQCPVTKLVLFYMGLCQGDGSEASTASGHSFRQMRVLTVIDNQLLRASEKHFSQT